MAVEVWQAFRAKGRSPRWSFRVSIDNSHIFEAAWVSVRYASRADAEWLANLIDRLVSRGGFAGCPGHRGQVAPVLWWGDLGDDHGATFHGINCHAEHLYGPLRGGSWYCQVSFGGEQLFHTAESGVQPRSGNAAWWLCEIVVCAARAGVLEPTAQHAQQQNT